MQDFGEFCIFYAYKTNPPTRKYARIRRGGIIQDMRVKVKFFAAHRKAVGESELEVELEENATIDNLIEKLIGKYPKLKKLDKYTIASLNHSYAKRNQSLKDGDEVALFPPVEGG